MKNITPHLPKLINISGYTTDYISKKMGLTAADFLANKNQSSWSADEVMQLMTIIENEAVDDYLLLQLMREDGKDETITADEFRKEVHQ